MQCLHVRPPQEPPPPAPASGTKWLDSLQVLPLEWESKGAGTKSENFAVAQDGLSHLVRQLAMKATKATTQKALLSLSSLICEVAEGDQTTKTTDSGGGGALRSFQRSMPMLLLCKRARFIAPCAPPGVSSMLANSVKAAFGEGGLDCRSAA